MSLPFWKTFFLKLKLLTAPGLVNLAYLVSSSPTLGVHHSRPPLREPPAPQPACFPCLFFFRGKRTMGLLFQTPPTISPGRRVPRFCAAFSGTPLFFFLESRENSLPSSAYFLVLHTTLASCRPRESLLFKHTIVPLFFLYSELI